MSTPLIYVSIFVAVILYGLFEAWDMRRMRHTPSNVYRSMRKRAGDRVTVGDAVVTVQDTDDGGVSLRIDSPAHTEVRQLPGQASWPAS